MLIPWEAWASDLNLDEFPKPLPTRQQIADESQPEVAAQVRASLRSLAEYLVPWPDEETRAQLTSPEVAGRFAVAWLATRLNFYETLVGLDEHWTMFSPSVADEKTLTRARLLYADGSERLVRTSIDPEDLTHFAHWLDGKIVSHERKMGDASNRRSDCRGWCNLLAHRYPRNEAGSPLWRIVLYEVQYKFPRPGEDARAVLEEQLRKTRHLSTPEYRANLGTRLAPGEKHLRLDRNALPVQVYPDYYEYDPEQGTGHRLH